MDLYEELRYRLEQRYPDYSVPNQPIHGTYGTVIILDGRAPWNAWNRFVLKTVELDSDKLAGRPDLRALFERELRVAFGIPRHYNILPAEDIQFFRVGDFQLPAVRLPYRNGNLREWNHKAPRSYSERLWALVQLVNGLAWLYAQGIQGHGDLKPENVLYRDLSASYIGSDPTAPSRFQFQIADLGWADIWREAGCEHLTFKGFRPYVAPERMQGVFVPQASDIFSLGVIIFELLTNGSHPYGKKVPTAQHDWHRWIERETDNLEQLADPDVRELVRTCLARSPERRPRAQDVRAVLGDVLARENGSGMHPVAFLDGVSELMRRETLLGDEFVRA